MDIEYWMYYKQCSDKTILIMTETKSVPTTIIIQVYVHSGSSDEEIEGTKYMK